VLGGLFDSFDEMRRSLFTRIIAAEFGAPVQAVHVQRVPDSSDVSKPKFDIDIDVYWSNTSLSKHELQARLDAANLAIA
jgi:hypothetical protein